MDMIREPLVYYDKLYRYTNNHPQEKIKDLADRLNEISKQDGYNVLGVNSPSRYSLDNRNTLLITELPFR